MSSATVMFVLARMLAGAARPARLRARLRPRPLGRDHALPRRLTMRRRSTAAEWMDDAAASEPNSPARCANLARINR